MPLFFLLGPDLGGGDWQARMYERLKHYASKRNIVDFVAVIPKRYPADHPIRREICNGAVPEFQFQLEWERHFIEQAALKTQRGCVIAWLPEESRSEPRIDGEPYARDTRAEIGEIRGWMMFDKRTRFLFGGEKGFPGLDVVVRNFSSAIDYKECLALDSIDALANGAVQVASRPQRWP